VNSRAALWKYGFTSVFAGLSAWLILELHGFADLTEPAEKYRLLADAFTVPGVTLMMLWLLILFSGEGIFDGIGYALSCTAGMLFPGTSGHRAEAYSDYLGRRRERRAAGKSCSFLWHTGTAFMLPAVICIALFYASG